MKMARMRQASVVEEGKPDVSACVVAEKHASYDSCSTVPGNSSEKESVSGMLRGGTKWSPGSCTEVTSCRSSSDDVSCSSAKATPSVRTAQDGVMGETSALLPSHMLRSRSKKACIACAGESHGAYGGVVALVGDADYYSGSPPLANSVLSCLIAMLQGVEVLCNLPILYLYKDDFLLNPAVLAIALGALKVPWTIKPLWALMSDNLPLFGYRRKSYIFIGSSLCITALLSLGLFGYRNLWTTTVLLFLYFAGSAMCNVIGEALVVEAGRKASNEEGAANSVSVFFAFRKISFAIMSYLSGFLLMYMDKRFVFVLGTTLPLAVFVTNFFLTETPAIVLPLKEQLERLLEIMKRPVVLNSTLFIFLMMSTPSAGSIMFYYMTNELKFGPELLGRMALFQSIASLLGIFTYWWFFRRTNLRKLLLVSTLFVTPFCLLPVILVQRWNVRMGIPDTAFVVTDTVLMEFVGELQTMPVLVLGARLCPPGLESSIYSFLLSAYNFGLGFGSLLSAGMTAAYGISSTNFENLTSMIVVCALTNLLPLGVLWLVPDTLSSTAEEREIDRGPESSFTSDTEAGISQASTRAASDAEKGTAGSSRRYLRSRSSSESSDSDVGVLSCGRRRYSWFSVGLVTCRHARSKEAIPSQQSNSSVCADTHAASYTPVSASPEAAAERLVATAAPPPYSASRAAGTITAGGYMRETAAPLENVDRHAAALGSANEEYVAISRAPSAPAAADIVAAAMESGGSGECTGAAVLPTRSDRTQH